MEKHTQAKLEAHRYPTHYVITTEGIGTQIVYMKRDPVVLQECWDRQLADAARLAAAWNAVQTIPTEALTPGSVKALIEAMTDVRTALLKQADSRYIPTLGDLASMLDKADAALAPFKGAQEVRPNAESPA